MPPPSDDAGTYLAAALSRRRFLARSASAAAAGLAGAAGLLVPLTARAANGEVHDFRPGVRINGDVANARSVIRAGDRIVTDSNGYFVVAIGRDAFMLRSRTEMVLERETPDSVLITGLRLFTGAMGAVFGKGPPRRIASVTVTAGIRGTGVYLETRGPDVYFCTCYGEVELAPLREPGAIEMVRSTRHAPRIVRAEPRDGRWIEPSAMDTHTDAEMDMLEKCVGRRAPWI